MKKFRNPIRSLFRNASLKGKLLSVILVTTSIALLSSYAIMMVNDLYLLRQGAARQLAIHANIIGANSTTALSGQKYGEVQGMLEALRFQPDITQAAIFGREGTILAQHGVDFGVGFTLQMAARQSAEFSVESLSLSRDISLGGERLGTIYLRSDLGVVRTRIEEFIGISLIVFLVSVVVSVLLSSRIQRTISGPIVELTDVARRVSEHSDYSLRAEKRDPDEVGMLIDNFNSMLTQIQERDERLAEQQERLEELVSERTEELTRANDLLLQENTARERIESRLRETAMDLEANNLQLELSRDQALDAARAKADFLATMSHEIRTPMNGVIGMTGLLLETELTHDQRYYAETVRGSSDALLTIINDILDFSKIEAGKLDLEIIDFDLQIALEETLDLLAERASSKKLELTGLVFEDVPTALRGDPGRIRQVLMNLVGNAIKFTQAGEVGVQVLRVEETDVEAVLRFHISDTGIGISPEEQGMLFHSFSQADSSTTRKFGGTGLGLAISKQLVELMGGEIGVTSEAGKGSVFWFTIRLEKQTGQPRVLSRTSLEGLRLCCVDDNATNRYLMTQYAQDWDMDSSAASTPAEALALLQSSMARGKPFDVCIIDGHMPGMDGLTLGRAIKGDPKLAHVKLILLTSIGHRGEAATARKAGFGAYLSKPIRKSQLYEGLATLLGDTAEPMPLGETQLLTRHTLKEHQQQRSGKVLVADDHTVNQHLAVLMLQRLGYRADVVANGLEAVEALRRVPYSLVLMDCQMPEMDGYEATKEIRRLQAQDELYGTFRVPIIAMTANAMQGDREKCLAAGMDDYVTKPIKPDRLGEVVAKWLPKHETRTASDERRTTSNEQRATKHEIQAPQNGESLTVHASGFSPIDHVVIAEWQSVGGAGFVERMLQQFVDDATSCVVRVEQAVEHADARALADAAHGLKGICQNMGARRLAEIAAILERQCRSGSIEAASADVAELKAELVRIDPSVIIPQGKLSLDFRPE